MKPKNKILRTIILILPATKAKMGGELGAMLGQYNLNIMKFCNEFNEISKIYEINLPLVTHLNVLEGNTFEIELKGPTFSFMLKSLSKNTKLIPLFTIYKVALIRFTLQKNKVVSLSSMIKNIISSIGASKNKIKYE